MSHKSILTLFVNNPMDTSISEDIWDAFKAELLKENKLSMKSAKWNFGHFVVMRKNDRKAFKKFVSAFNQEHKVKITISGKP